MRQKANISTGNIKEDAKLNFCIAMAYETNKNYLKSIKFYKNFFFISRNKEDKVGMALASNRISILYVKLHKYEKSIEFHINNLNLSESENKFSGNYNLGIIYRNLN